MALHRFLGIEIGAPDPAALADCYGGIGLVGADDTWGTADVPGQIHLVEAPYRQLRSMRIGCESEEDLAGVAGRLQRLGIDATASDEQVSCLDPTGSWTVTVEVAEPEVLSSQTDRDYNHPGDRARTAARADVVVEDAPRPPRRLGHVVVGAPDTAAMTSFFLDGIGFRMSDEVAGLATFMRCSSDHHNLLVQPGPVPYLNHYAFEFDDIDAIGKAATAYLDGQEDRHVVGLGRHIVGSNVFWYMTDPAGTMFEFFSDMDDIPDDDAWEPRTDWPLEAFSTWGPTEPPFEFAFPTDLDQIAAAREAEGR